MKKGFLKKALAVIVAVVLMIGISAGTSTIIHKKGSAPASTPIKNGLSAYELAVENGYSGTVQEWLSSLSGKSAYDIAVEGGYDGTETEWSAALTKLANSDIVGIKTAAFNAKGELVLTLADETTINLGKAVGVDGVNGKDGIDGQDGKNGTDGKNGIDGKDGSDGKDGVGVSDVDINDAGELVLSFSDETIVNLGKVVGTSGLNGLSAYEIAVLTRKTTATSEEEWIESLKGDEGNKGDKGDAGSDGDTPYIKDGNWWIGTTDTGIAATGPKGDKGETGTTGAQGLKGDKGDTGSVGATGTAGLTPHIDTNGNWWIGTTDTGIRANGKSAYEVALENDPNLTYGQWTESLKGSTGANGKSAYELAVETGLVSSSVTVENWLASLKGADGKNGISPVVRINSATNEWEISIDGGNNYTSTGVKATGEKGADGQNGAKGADGISPKIRINNNNEWEVSIDNGETYTATGVKATGANGNDGSNGDDGLTPEVKDGIWWIGETNTGVIAEGKDGKNGKDAVAPQIRIDATNNMWEISIDGGVSFTSTNVKATGDVGATGESAYAMAKRLGLTNADNETAFIQSLKGENGITPEIGQNGNWWIGTTDTGVKAAGEKGADGEDGDDGVGIDNITLSNGVMTITLTNSEKVYTFENIKGADGITPQLIIEDGKWKVSYDNGDTYTELGKATGADGITPTISDDGYWQFGDQKTACKAVATDGVNGVTPQLKIENDKWYVSYDDGTSYTELGAAKGEKGDDGDNGISPIIKDGYWYIGEENTNVPATGANGTNGITPILKIEKDYWFVSYDNGDNYTPLNTKAVGEDGQNGNDGDTPEIKDGYWYIGGESTGVKAEAVDGANGKTPYIQNGTWWIDGVDTEVAVTGQNGENGENGKTPEIGANGNWWIDGVDTGKKAVAQDGVNGGDGADGDGIVGITVNEENFLVIDMKYGEDIVIEKSIVGEKGADGNGIKSITLNADDELVIETDNGTTTLGPIRGKTGDTGAKGTGIKSVALNENFELAFTMDDENGTIHTIAGSIKGADGVGIEEVKIENDILKIKYTNSDTFIDLGNVKGDKGDPGEQGPQGPAGTNGVDGKSAYELYKQEHPEYTGTLEDWLNSLKGETGRGILKTEFSETSFIVYYTDGTSETHDLSDIIGDPNEKEILVFSKLSDGTYGVMAGGMAKYEAAIEIPATHNGVAVTQILAEGFSGHSSLRTLTVPDTVTEIGNQAFYECSGLTEVTLSNSLESIGRYAFYNCTSLKEIVIPSTVTFIGEYAFYGAALESVTMDCTTAFTIGEFTGYDYYSYSYHSTTMKGTKYASYNYISIQKKRNGAWEYEINVDISDPSICAEVLRGEKKYDSNCKVCLYLVDWVWS